MQNLLNDYQNLFDQQVALQQRLVPVFEKRVSITQPSFDQVNRSWKLYVGDKGHDLPLLETLTNIIQPDRSVVDIMKRWPKQPFPPLNSIAPMFLWVKPSQGVIVVDNNLWGFNLHGTQGLTFGRVPTQLSQRVTRIRQNSTIQVTDKDIFSHLPDKWWLHEEYLCLDVSFLPGGRTNGVCPWSAYLYANSRGGLFKNLNESQHQAMLDYLVNEDILEKIGRHYFKRNM